MKLHKLFVVRYVRADEVLLYLYIDPRSYIVIRSTRIIDYKFYENIHVRVHVRAFKHVTKDRSDDQYGGTRDLSSLNYTTRPETTRIYMYKYICISIFILILTC